MEGLDKKGEWKKGKVDKKGDWKKGKWTRVFGISKSKDYCPFLIPAWREWTRVFGNWGRPDKSTLPAQNDRLVGVDYRLDQNDETNFIKLVKKYLFHKDKNTI